MLCVDMADLMLLADTDISTPDSLAPPLLALKPIRCCLLPCCAFRELDTAATSLADTPPKKAPAPAPKQASAPGNANAGAGSGPTIGEGQSFWDIMVLWGPLGLGIMILIGVLIGILISRGSGWPWPTHNAPQMLCIFCATRDL